MFSSFYMLLITQVAWKLEETRKYYVMYNTQDTSLKLLQKEVCTSYHNLYQQYSPTYSSTLSTESTLLFAF
jgi:hypothetical protein